MNTATPTPPDFYPTRTTMLKGIRDYDEESWRDFHNRYHRLLKHFALKYGLNEADASEAVQHTFITVAQKIPGFSFDRKKGKFRNWLLTIGKHKILKLLTHQQKRRALECSMSEEDVLPDISDIPDLAKSTSVRRYEQEEVLNLILNQLRREFSTDDYMIFELHYLKGWNAKEVAKMVERSVTSVYVTKHRIYRRALRLIQEIYDDMQGGDSGLVKV